MNETTRGGLPAAAGGTDERAPQALALPESENRGAGRLGESQSNFRGSALRSAPHGT